MFLGIEIEIAIFSPNGEDLHPGKRGVVLITKT